MSRSTKNPGTYSCREKNAVFFCRAKQHDCDLEVALSKRLVSCSKCDLGLRLEMGRFIGKPQKGNQNCTDDGYWTQYGLGYDFIALNTTKGL